MKKIYALLTLLSLQASDSSQKIDSVLFSADVVDIKKIQQKYPNLEMHKVEKVALCYKPSLYESLKNAFVNSNKISNKDRAYFFTTQTIIDELAKDHCIENVHANENHS